MAYARRKDTTHSDFVEWLEARGWTLFDVHAIGGFVDAIGVKRSRVVFFEFKSEAKPDNEAKKQREKKQESLHAKLRRAGAEVYVVRSLADLSRLEEAA